MLILRSVNKCFLSFFKNRKSRKQLLQEIEELKAEVLKQQSYKVEETLKLDSIKKQIKTVSAACIYNSGEFYNANNKTDIEDCLCRQLAKELLPFISVERYAYAPINPHFYGEEKYIGTIKVVEMKS